ncbi:hypothetical protein [Komagataeibacter sp. FNDCR2]|uniref:hypothetical protein n=1 Tax=Komagataeibacter sp. FNDCR2 TaxID=2878682 RepID=UPI001E3DBEDA|nr:hypothetical protein [Komagataeibacter sp. FNDCR2]MCE2574194.1 hypothetical protein [Komagataeibacter sp. FNDCR2]
MIDHIRQFNGGRTLLMNTGVFFCIVVMMGIANLVCRFVLQTDMSYLVPWLISGMGVYFFIPSLILWVATGSSSGHYKLPETDPL